MSTPEAMLAWLSALVAERRRWRATGLAHVMVRTGTLREPDAMAGEAMSRVLDDVESALGDGT